ncbi:hypothetical protein [Flavobacterium sp. 14A]|uniref:hypothetical protein n=1 Tax=Flavobacterium sp. 14A TaxID=2735896 RepID=UPI00156DEAA0|nr:hypothetical protein [Flavobacterium sp. 14A]NRT12878.1 hypothetical protein [Flavobacterium sp. 14A]
MTFPTLSYLQFLWHSKNEHAVHSPFVFSLLTKCFYDRKPKPAYTLLKTSLSYSEQLRSSAALSQKNSQFLYRLHAYFDCDHSFISEATDGLAVLAVALSSKTKKINVQAAATFPLETMKAVLPADTKVAFTTASLKDSMRMDAQQQYDFIYFDNYSDTQQLLTAFKTTLPSSTNDSVWVFNQLHKSKATREAWEHIKQQPEVSVTVDSYYFQLVFFRREQPKEHFIIRQ